MSINRTAEYVVLWKSHKRAEWAAVGLDNQAAARRQQLARNDANALLSSTPAASTGEYLSTGTATPAASTGEYLLTGTATETAAETTTKMAAKVGAVAVAQRAELDLAAPSVDVLAEISDELKFLENESRRMWQLSAEIGAELAQTEALLTFAQRQKAEQMLKQWEESGAGL